MATKTFLHAPNPETMTQGQALFCLKIGNAGGSPQSKPGPAAMATAPGKSV